MASSSSYGAHLEVEGRPSGGPLKSTCSSSYGAHLEVERRPSGGPLKSTCSSSYGAHLEVEGPPNGGRLKSTSGSGGMPSKWKWKPSLSKKHTLLSNFWSHSQQELLGTPTLPSAKKHSLVLRPSIWSVVVTVVLFSSILLIVSFKTQAIPERWASYKIWYFVGMAMGTSICAAGAHSSSELAPAPTVRLMMVFVILSTTIALTIMILNMGYSWKNCWFAFSMLWSTLVACPCCAVYHPPSFHARNAVNLLVTSWLGQVTHVVRMISQPSGGAARFETGLGNSCEIIPIFWSLLLVIRSASTLKKLATAVGVRMTKNLAKGKLILDVALYIGSEAFEAYRVRGVKQGDPSLKFNTSVLNLMKVVLAITMVLTGVLVIKDLAFPIRILRREFDKVTGPALSEAKWAHGVLCYNLIAAALTCSASSICFLGWAACRFQAFDFIRDDHKIAVGVIKQGLICTCVAALSGILLQHRTPKMQRPPRSTKAHRVSGDDTWNAKVCELASRGVSLRHLVSFYERLLKGELMQAFDPEKSTTNDVVRCAIIPLSLGADGQGHSLAEVWSNYEETPANKMVTHNWGNCFSYLLAAIIADALDCLQYELVLPYLTNEAKVPKLKPLLEAKAVLDQRYWICAFCINQHASICGGFGPEPPIDTPNHEAWEKSRRCTVTGEVYPLCHCSTPKYFNDNPQLCELNKFDDMMAAIHARQASFVQVVAVDLQFELFARAWCLAELIVADSIGIDSKVKIHSAAALEEKYEALAELDVRRCSASRPEDTEEILQKIEDVSNFNHHLEVLIFGANGLFDNWLDFRTRTQVAAKVAMRAAKGQHLVERRNSSPPSFVEAKTEIQPLRVTKPFWGGKLKVLSKQRSM